MTLEAREHDVTHKISSYMYLCTCIVLSTTGLDEPFLSQHNHLLQPVPEPLPAVLENSRTEVTHTSCILFNRTLFHKSA